MSNTKWKQIELRFLNTDHALPDIKGAWPESLYAESWKADHASLDVPFARSSRLIFSHHGGGSDEWMVGNDDPEGQLEYPDPHTWRTVLRHRCELGRGQVPVFKVIALESGWTQVDSKAGVPQDIGPGSEIQCLVTFQNPLNSESMIVMKTAIPPSPNEWGAENLEAAQAWKQVVPLIYGGHVVPHDDVNSEEIAKWSEWPTVTFTLQVRGGARIIHASMWETPRVHAAAHDDTDVSIHQWTGEVPFATPQIREAHGADFEEHRFGLLRSLAAATKQQQRWGPHIAQWGCYAEGIGDVFDIEPSPVQITSTSYIGLSVGSEWTSWTTEAPGFQIVSPPGGRVPQALHTRLRQSADEYGEKYASAIPVRARVYARFTTNNGVHKGYVRFQSSDRCALTIEVPESDTWKWYTLTGWLEASSSGSDWWPNLMDFVKVSGGTMEIRYWSLDYGDYPVINS